MRIFVPGNRKCVFRTVLSKTICQDILDCGRSGCLISDKWYNSFNIGNPWCLEDEYMPLSFRHHISNFWARMFIYSSGSWLELNASKRSLNFSRYVAVGRHLAGRILKWHKRWMPLATLWLKIWVANFTIILENAVMLICFCEIC